MADSFHEVDKGTARDLIGALGWATNKDYERGLVRQLLVEQPPELESGRCLLYVCPECGDIGCGAVTALITADNGNVTWERFRYENDWEEDMWNEAWYRSIGPFRFDKRQYRERLLNPPPKELSV